ncbi:MAG: caspase domain-containing protein, partial [Xenococcus sp. (in: cyanobacteria)]
MSSKVALLIGVSEYGEGIPSLSAPRNDVTAMKRVLKNPKMGGFDDVEILSDPDLAQMQKAVQQIFTSRSKDDLVLLFFSGHGFTDDNNKLYFATKGTSKNFYKATSVPASFIQDVSLECYARRQVMILDCSFSGAFAESWMLKSSRYKGLESELGRELGAEGRVVLTSSTAVQKSFQREDGEFSLYTQYILEGIETGAADNNSDGKIYAHELHEYAKAKVKEAKPRQEPGILIDGEGFNILISQAPINDPELSFRKLVEKYAVEGRIILVGKYILQVKQQDLGITNERAQKIIDEVLAPYRKRLENIEIYKEAFTEVVKHSDPLTERFVIELQSLQDILGLEDQDVAKLKEQKLWEYYSVCSQQIRELLYKLNRVNLEQFPKVYRDFIQQKFDKEYDYLNLVFRSDEVTLEVSELKRMNEFKKIWTQSKNTLVQNDIAKFRSNTDKLTGLFCESLAFKLLDDSGAFGQLYGRMIDASNPAFQLNIRSSFPLIYACKISFSEKDVSRINGLLNQFGISADFFALLVVFGKHQQVRQQVRNSPFKNDFIVLNHDQLWDILAAKSPIQQLTNCILEQIDLIAVSPYTVGGPVPEKMFFGRAEEEKTLLQNIARNDYALLANRKTGKTSLLNKISARLKALPNFQVFNCDLQAVSDYESFFGELTISYPVFEEEIIRLSELSPLGFRRVVSNIK